MKLKYYVQNRKQIPSLLGIYSDTFSYVEQNCTIHPLFKTENKIELLNPLPLCCKHDVEKILKNEGSCITQKETFAFIAIISINKYLSLQNIKLN